MVSIFVDVEEFEKAPPVALRRTLLELVAIRYVVKGERSVPLGRMLKDAGLSAGRREASLALRAVAHNNVVYVDHQEMYNSPYLSSTTHLDVFIECNHQFVKKWASKAGGGDNVHSLDAVSQDIRDAMIRELDDSIGQLKKYLKDSVLDTGGKIIRR